METTTFVYDEWHDYYDCGKCGLAWQIPNDYTLKENNVNYCPKCGRYINLVKRG